MKTMTPRDTHAKGRNGYFKVASIEVWEYSQDPRTHIEVRSRRPASAAPCRLELSPEDRREFVKLLQSLEDDRLVCPEGVAPELMMPGTDGWDVDGEIEAGLACPNCGSRRLRTVQQGTRDQDADDGEWTTAGARHEWSETIEARCRECDAVIWENPMTLSGVEAPADGRHE